MKIGVRKASIKKSISARTTGKVKRSIKRSINPTYGKKGMGWINNPQKAMYNKVYNKTTFGVSDVFEIVGMGFSILGTVISIIAQLLMGLFNLVLLIGIIYILFVFFPI